MTPTEYVADVVRPNLTDLDLDFDSIRHALNAIHSVDALAARIYVAAGGKAATGEKSDTHYRDALAGKDADFRLLRDLAKAVKHIDLTQGTPTVSSATAVTAEGLGWGEGAWGEGRWGSPPQVVVRTDSGDVRVVQAVLENALAFLETEMTRLGL